MDTLTAPTAAPIHRALDDLWSTGLALCAIVPGEKRPRGRHWQVRPVTDHAGFIGPQGEECQVGILCGPLSGGIVCVDLDCVPTATADALLPPTAMEDGRPGRERSHRWYRLTDTTWPDACLPAPGTQTREAMEAGSLPRFCGSRNCTGTPGPDGQRRGVELKGAGTMAICPPSLTPSGSRRSWHTGHRGDPASIPYATLITALESTAHTLGWGPAARACGEDGQRAASQREVPLGEAGTEALTDTQVLHLARCSRTGHDILALWSGEPRHGSPSEDDAALIAHLAFYTRDPVQLERLWLASPCGQRPKTQERTDYRERTIAHVLALVRTHYHPPRRRGRDVVLTQW